MSFVVDGYSPIKWGVAASIVLNPSDKGANVTLSGSNSTATKASGSAWENARCVTALTSGRWYWEVKMLAAPASLILGMMDSGASLTVQMGGSANGWGAFFNGSLPISVTGITRDYATNLPSNAINDVLGIAFDRSTGKAFMHKNGTYFNSGDPVAGTGSVVSGATSGNWFPAVGVFDTTTSIQIITDRASFSFAMPAGFQPYGAAGTLVQ